jgi:hypothetical protein
MNKMFELPKPVKLTSIPPASEPVAEIWTGDLETDCVDPPLVKACAYLLSLNIQILGSRANQHNAVNRETAYIDIDYNSLSDEHKKVAVENCTIFEDNGQTVARLKIRTNIKSTADVTERESMLQVRRFRKPSKKVQTFPVERESAQALGLYYDEESGKTFLNEASCKMWHAKK